MSAAIELATKADFRIVVDQAETARQISDAAVRRGVHVCVLGEYSLGELRTGQPTVDGAVELMILLDRLPHLTLEGIQAYSPATQHAHHVDRRRDAAAAAAQKLSCCLDQLTKSGLPLEIVTGSGTGAFEFDLAHGLYTEYQAGSYAVMDTDYREIGLGPVAQCFETAVAVLGTVVGRQHGSVALIDIGQKTLFRGGPPPRCLSHDLEDATIEFAGDEQLRVSGNRAESLHLGERIAFETTHCDPTIALHSRFEVAMCDGDRDRWTILSRG